MSRHWVDPRPRRFRHSAALLLTIAAVAVAGAPSAFATEMDEESVTPPNILVFLSDDMGWGQPGFNGATEVTTPSMDRIANEGVKLTQFYVQPVCSATRGSLLTGRYPWKNGTEPRVGLRDSQGMLTDERTIAEALRDAGYATWIIGKWHLGQWQQDHLPLQRGFDHHYGHYSGEIHSFTHHRGRSRRGILDWHRNERPVVESGYSTFLLANEAIQLIERHDGESPFFLYLPFNAVHNPNQAPDEYLEQYDDLDDHEQRAQLKAMDDAIGQVLDALERKGVLDDTLVIFLNDNGGAQSAGWNEPYRGKKSGFFEGGIRVPAVMRWPDEIPSGSESDALLHVVDLFPTLAGLAGADTTSGLPLDGVHAWAAIAEGGASPREEVVYADGVIRKGDWKLIDDYVDYYDPAPDSVLLYNIEDDPYEETNQASGNAAKVTELRARLDYHRAFARDGEATDEIPDHPPKMYGAQEDEIFGTAARRAVTQLLRGNPAPTLLRIAASKSRVALVYDETLDADAVPSADAFAVVVNPGYVSAQVTGVAVSGNEVVLTLASEVTAGNTVGLTYEVPDTGATQDADDLEAVGVVWVTDEAEDEAAFTVTAAPGTIAEAQTATLTVAITNGATFADDQTVTLVVSGTATTSDYSVPATVTLTAGTTSTTATLTALDDQEEESDETLTVAASRGGASIGSATVTIQSVSHDATLSAFGLSGIDIGRFSSAVTSYTATVAQDIETTIVTATANHAEAVLSITSGTEVSLAEGENEIAVTVTAEDGTTTQTYTVTVTRTSATTTEFSEATIAADAASVTEGTAASFTVTLGEAATAAVTVALSVSEAGSVVSGTAPASVTIAVGATTATLTVATDDDSVVEDDGTVTASLSAGTGYTVGSDDSAEVTVADNDTAAFAVTANPSGIDEGGSSTVTVSVSNGVTFADDQTISLAVSGTAASGDHTLSETSLTLTAGAGSVAATVTAVDDTDEEDEETVVVTASRDGASLGSATVTIAASDSPNRAPEFDGGTSASRSVAENAAVGTAVGAAVSASDADRDSLTYSLAGTDASDFTIDTLTGQLRTAAVLDHEAGSSRSVTVSVIDGNGGSASIIVTITVTDVDEPPVAPAAPTVSGASRTSLSVSWSAPANAGRPAVTDYDVQYREGASGGFADWSHTGASTAATITGLSAGTLYQVQVLARNAEGASGWSASGEGSTPAVQPPGQVTDLSVTAGDERLTVSWTVQPGADGYRVQWQSGSQSYSSSRQLDVSGGSTASAVIGSLSNGTKYTVRASAYNAGGHGTWSDEGTGTPGATEDGAGEGDVRLVDGSGEHEGRVEIYHAGQWGTVCDDYWTGDDAEVVCRQLGYTGLATAYTRAHFGEGADPIWMDNTQCEGGEARLADCAFAGWGVQNCRHSEDAGVGCDASSTLSLSDTFLSGAELTLQYSGQPGAGSTPSPRDFVVLATGADGTRAVRVERVAVSGSRAVLGLSQAVPPSDAVTLSYLVAPMHPIEDPSGNPAEPVQDVAVRHGGVIRTTASHTVDGTHGALDSWAHGGPVSQAELLHAALSGAVKLERLDLSSRGLSDVSLLWGLSNLERLALGDNAISDLWPLAELTDLGRLDLSDNRVVDITALAGLTHLRRLDLSNNRISDVSALAGLANLRRLNLSNNRISDISALMVLPRLEVLLVDGNVMDEVIWVSQFKAPVNLGLSGNRITEVSLLAGSGSLKRLDLSGNRVSDITALGGLPELEWLRLDRNPIADPWPLNGLDRLRWVWLDAGLPDVRTSLPAASTDTLGVFQIERLEPERRPQ